jgi:hypothetical protein
MGSSDEVKIMFSLFEELRHSVQQMSSERQNVRGPIGTAPERRTHSARRTSTIDMTWPAGIGTQLRLEGRARDIVTQEAGSAPIVIATGIAHVGIGADRMIEDIAIEPVREGAQRLVGCRGGGYLRAALDEMLPGEREAGTPLYLLLDDVSGTSLIAGFAWSRHTEDWLHLPQRAPRPEMENVCIGFATGSSALNEIREGRQGHRVQPVGTLVHPDDPYGWPELIDLPKVSMRRARRIDVWKTATRLSSTQCFKIVRAIRSMAASRSTSMRYERLQTGPRKSLPA